MMDEVWATGRRHVKISKLYLKALLRRGPNIFVALAWSQVFWLVLELAAGNEDSHGYVRLSSVACYAFALHVAGHMLLFYFHRNKLNHHALEFLLDLVTDVVGFAWINFAEEMLAQVFLVTARTTFLYAALSYAASLGAMEIGSCIRGLLDWPLGFDETANQFDAGSFALPTSWLVTQAVHIALYGFFYRTSAQAAAGGQSGTGSNEDEEVNVRLAASLFLLVYALLCSTLATRLLGGTVAAEVVHGGGGGLPASGDRSDLVIRAVEAGGPFTAGMASDAATMASTPHPGRGHSREPVEHRNSNENDASPLLRGGRAGSRIDGGAGDIGSVAMMATSPDAEEAPFARGTPRPRCQLDQDSEDHSDEDHSDEENKAIASEGGAAAFAAAALSATTAAINSGRARRESLHRAAKTYSRLTVGMMVGWAYNLWGQVEFRQEELEFRFGPALGATLYATLSTALGVCIMVRGADRLDAREEGNGRRGLRDGERGLFGEEGRMGQEEEEETYKDAVRAFHAKRMLVVVGGVSLMVGWAWEEAFDLMLEACVGDSADAGMIAAKLALAVVSTVVVLGLEVRSQRHDDHDAQGIEGHHGGDFGRGGVGVARGDADGLLEPLILVGSEGIQ